MKNNKIKRSSAFLLALLMIFQVILPINADVRAEDNIITKEDTDVVVNKATILETPIPDDEYEVSGEIPEENKDTEDTVEGDVDISEDLDQGKSEEEVIEEDIDNNGIEEEKDNPVSEDLDENINLDNEEVEETETIGKPETGKKTLVNIFENPKILINGEEAKSEKSIFLENNIKYDFSLDWSIDNSVEKMSEVYSIIDLPNIFEIVSQKKGDIISDGESVGKYTIYDQGEGLFLKFEFNDVLNNMVDRSGSFKMGFQLNEEKVKDSEKETISIETNPSKKWNLVLNQANKKPIEKTVERIGTSNILKWTVVINSNYQNIENPILEDVLSKGQSLVEESIKISGGKSHELIKLEDDGFAIKLTGPIDEPVTITYESKIDNILSIESSETYTNKAVFKDGDSFLGEDKAEIQIDKIENLISKEGKLSEDKKQIIWTITINENNLNLGKVEFKDELPEGLKLVEGLIGGESKNTLEETFDNLTEKKIIEYTTDIDISKYYNEKDYTNKASIVLVDHSNTSYPAEDTVKHTRGEFLTKNVAQLESYDEVLFEWTIEVDGSIHDLGDYVIKDKLSDNHEYVASTLEVTGAKENEADFKDGLLTLSIEEKGGEKVTITYQTRPKYTSDEKLDLQVYENQVEIVNDEFKEDTYKIGSLIKEQKNQYYKRITSINYDEKTIDWEIVIDASKEKIGNVVIKDTIENNNMVLVEDSIKHPEFELTSKNKSGFALNNEGILARGKYEITYKTSFDPNSIESYSNDIKNNLDITFDLYKPTSKGEYKVYKDKTFNQSVTGEISTIGSPENIAKDIIANDGKKIGHYNSEDNTITWDIYINPFGKNIKGFEIKDSLDENISLIADSVKANKYSLNSGGVIVEGDSLDVQVKDENKTIIFKSTEEFSEGIHISYKTKIEGIAKKEYTNIAKYGEKEYSSTVEKPDYNKYIEKTGKHKSGSNENRVFFGDILDWEIKINEARSELSGVKIIDKISEGHIYKEGSLTVKTKDGKDVSYSLSVLDNQVDRPTNLEIEIEKCNEELIIKYETQVLISTEGAPILNKANLTAKEEGFGETSSESSKFTLGSYSEASGSGENRLKPLSLTINKIDEETSEGLEGAIFNLYKIDSSGGKTLVVDNLITDASGNVKVNDLLAGDYEVEEVKAPEGYLLLQENTIIKLEDTEVNKSIDIRNSKISRGSLKLEKHWYGEANEYPEIEVQLERRIKESTDEFEKVGDPIKLATEKSQSKINYVFEDLLLTDDKGQAYEYRVVEADLDGYNISYIETEEALIIENIQKDYKGTIDIVKLDNLGDKVEGTIFYLYKDGNFIKSGTTDKNGELQFSGLDWGQYSIREVSAPNKYYINKDKIDFTLTYKNPKAYAEVINRIREKTSDIKVEKKWENGSNPVQPEKVTVILLANGKELKRIELSEENNWTGYFTNLYNKDQYNSKIDYTIKEVDVEKYVANIEIVDGNFIITNTYKESTEPEEPTKPVEPTEPEEPTKPVEPTEPEEPTKPVKPTEPQVPIEPGKPTDPVRPTEPNKPGNTDDDAVLGSQNKPGTTNKPNGSNNSNVLGSQNGNKPNSSGGNNGSPQTGDQGIISYLLILTIGFTILAFIRRKGSIKN